MASRATFNRLAFSTTRRAFSTTPAARVHYLDATPEVFNKQIAGDRTVLVDFYADWCGPCKVLTPVLKRVVKPEGEYDLMTVNTDDQQDLAAKFKVAALPTVLAIKNGEVLAKFVGAQPEGAVKQFLAALPK